MSAKKMPKARDWPPIQKWKEFREKGKDKTFLTKEEWQTYLKRPPVRYPRENLIKSGRPQKCERCSESNSPGNLLQAAHMIPFREGLQHLGLTPTFLDSPDNLCWAHSRKCNAEVKLDMRRSMKRLRECLSEKEINGEFPSYLLPEVVSAWKSSL